MKDQYVGDIGDFGKFGLIRWLLREVPEMKLGVNWYYTPDDLRTDGRHIDYLYGRKAHDFRRLDEGLFDLLKSTVERSERSVTALERSGVLPTDTIFFREETPFRRLKWAESAALAIRSADIVFVDPDIGLAPQLDRVETPVDPKYTSLNDLLPMAKRGQSLIIYQHAIREDTDSFAERTAQRIRGELGVRDVLCLRWLRVSTRLYFVLPLGRHASALHDAVHRFQETSWREHFRAISV